jgi:hypothetical protein
VHQEFQEDMKQQDSISKTDQQLHEESTSDLQDQDMISLHRINQLLRSKGVYEQVPEVYKNLAQVVPDRVQERQVQHDLLQRGSIHLSMMS